MAGLGWYSISNSPSSIAHLVRWTDASSLKRTCLRGHRLVHGWSDLKSRVNDVMWLQLELAWVFPKMTIGPRLLVEIWWWSIFRPYLLSRLTMRTTLTVDSEAMRYNFNISSPLCVVRARKKESWWSAALETKQLRATKHLVNFSTSVRVWGILISITAFTLSGLTLRPLCETLYRMNFLARMLKLHLAGFSLSPTCHRVSNVSFRSFGNCKAVQNFIMISSIYTLIFLPIWCLNALAFFTPNDMFL